MTTPKDLKDKEQPLVSVIVNCYNGEKYLKEALESIYAQTYCNWEIIFWDNASTDKSEEIVKYFDSKLYYFRGEETIPLGAARNKALTRARGEFIAFLDCDDIWEPSKLEKQIPLFNKDQKTALVISNAIQFNNQGIKKLFCKNKPKTGFVFRELLKNYFICLPTAVIRRKSLDDLNEWFDSRFSHIEESELFMRIAYIWKLDYVDEALARYRIHKESSSYLRSDLSPKETEMMISKFTNLYPDFEKNYYDELLGLQYYTQYYFALNAWKQGDNHNVRKRLRPFLFKKSRAIVPFLLSFFPYVFFEVIHTLFNRYIRRVPPV
tara:strand:+ start:9 stop:974 length:966 start_codon:yes stop_codon:yes gene_type:complete